MKRLIIIFLLTFVLDMIMLPLCSNHLLVSSYVSRHENKSIRVDIHNHGGKDASLKVVSRNKSRMPDRNKGVVVVEDELKSRWQEYKISIQAIKDGEIQVYLRGPDRREGRERYPVIVDYKNLRINGKALFSEQRRIWHDNPFLYKFKAKDGEVIHISFNARKHHFRLSDLTMIYQINLWMLATISIISLVLSYKLVNFIFKFKMLGNRSLCDIIFICTFFVLLFIPMSSINPEDKSDQENRTLAKKPVLLNRSGVNPKFGFDAEEWFNDRFLGRAWAIKLDSSIKYRFNRIYKKGGAVFLSDSYWMFNNWKLSVPQVGGFAHIKNQLNGLNKFCEENNIKLYILLVPYKGSIYREILEGSYGYSLNDDHQFIEYVDRLRKHTGVPIIYPYEQLRNARKDDYVFFKQDHHWTDWGAYTGYRALMNEIQKDFPDIQISSLDDYNKFTSRYIRNEFDRRFNIGHTTKLLGYDPEYAKNHLFDTEYNYYDHKNGNILKSKTENQKLFTCNTGGGYKILLTGNSQNENLLQFLPYSSSSLLFIRLNAGRLSISEQNKFLKYYKKDVLNFKPDILIYCVSSESCRKFLSSMTQN